MTETPGQPLYDERSDRPTRLSQGLAWVGIVAGVLFVVAVIFFSGFFLGWSSGGHHGWHRSYGADRSGCSMMGPGMMGPGMMGPGMMGPGMMGPGGPMAPQPSSATTAPTTPRP